jgi:hypothetical protein
MMFFTPTGNAEGSRATTSDHGLMLVVAIDTDRNMCVNTSRIVAVGLCPNAWDSG